MSSIYGALGLSDNETVMLASLGQRVVFDAVQQVLGDHNADMATATAFFIEEVTSDYKLRYKLPGGGRMQRQRAMGRVGQVKAYGSWDVALPLEDFGDEVGHNRIDFAYMDSRELARHIQTIQIRDRNTVRFEILRAILNNVGWTFTDERWGDLSVVPLANGDSVVYPPVVGSEDEATDTHYLESGYAASGISDSNNPFATMRDELVEHFGVPGGGANLIAFINNAQTAKVKALTDFDEVPDRFVRVGANTDVPNGLPTNVPGTIIGRVSECWISEWRFMPANYIYAQHLDAPPPLKMRVDPANTSLPRGLSLIMQDEDYPFTSSVYAHRFGVAVANRLNGVVMELGTGGTYSIPSGYTR